MASSEDATAAVSARGWGIALAAVAIVCVIAAIAAEGELVLTVPVWATAAVYVVYGALFVLFVRRLRGDSRGVWIAVALTIVAAGALTALVPSNAVIQFWAFPMIWQMFNEPRRALSASFVLALAVFVGFGISRGNEEGWLVSAVITQGVSFGVAVGMGLWLHSIYVNGLERERLLTELTSAQEELAKLHRDAGVTAERERLSRELHDTLAQSLAGSVLLIQRARRRLTEEALDDDGLALVEESVRTALVETRVLVAQNAPLELRGGGLAEALEQVTARFGRDTGTAVDLRCASLPPVDRDAQVAILRCAQEALANVRKHSGAHRVRIELNGDERGVTLTVRDDGRGFDPVAPTAGFGLSGLRDRLQLVGGELEVDGATGATRLRAWVPAAGAA